MALVNLGSTVVGISGTIGGITFAHNKAGWTAKCWSRSSNPKSSYQMDVRSNLTGLPAIWRSLTPSLQADWATFAASPPEVDHDPFGNVKLLSGYQWFIRINQRRQQVGLTTASTVPTSGALIAPTITAFTFVTPIPDDGACRITFSTSEFLAGEYAVAFLALGTGAGVAKVYRSYVYVGSEYANGADHLDLGLTIRTRYGQSNVGTAGSIHVYRQAADAVRSIPWTTITYCTHI